MCNRLHQNVKYDCAIDYIEFSKDFRPKVCIIKNLSRLDERPSALKEKVFTKLFEEAEIAKFTPTELKEYEDSLKAYRDVKNSIDTALEKGREEGMAKGLEKGREEGLEKGLAKGMEKEKIATARRLLSMGLSEEQVSTATELPLEEIQKLREQAWTFRKSYKNEERIWGYFEGLPWCQELYRSGYLTIKDYDEGVYTLGIPNFEVRKALKELL